MRFSFKGKAVLLTAVILLAGSAAAYAAATFALPTKLTTNNVFDGFQSMYVDGNKTVHVAYARSNDNLVATDSIYYAYKPGSGSWKTILVTNETSDAWERPTVLSYGTNAYVLAPVKKNNKHQIALFKITQDGVVSKIMITNNTTENFSPTMVNRNNVIYITWLKASADWKSRITLKKYNTTTGGMSSEKALSSYSYKSGVKLKRHGDKLHMIWTADSEAPAIFYRKMDLNGATIEQKKVDNVWEDVHASLAVDQGVPFVAYTINKTGSNSASINITIAKLVNGIFTKQIITNDALGIYNEEPEIQVKGNVSLVFQSTRYNSDPNNSTNDVVYMTGPLNKLITTRLTATLQADEGRPAIALDPNNKAHITYTKFDGKDDEIYYRYQNN